VFVIIPEQCVYREYMEQRIHEMSLYVYMNSMFVKNIRSAKYTCDMVVDKIAGSVISINRQ